MSQTRIAAVVAGTGSQPGLEAHNRASQIIACLTRNGQARRVMHVEFPTRFFNRLTPATTGEQEPHAVFDAHVRSAPVIGRHTAPHVAFGADQFAVFSILNHRLRSPSLNHASFAGPVPPNLAAYSTKTL